MHLRLEIYKETRFEGYDKLTFSSSDISKKKKKEKKALCIYLYAISTTGKKNLERDYRKCLTAIDCNKTSKIKTIRI